MKTLYVTASRTFASFYEESLRTRFHLVDRLNNPLGRWKEATLGADRPGRMFSSASQVLSHGLENPQQHHKETARRFAVLISKKIDERVRIGHCDSIVITASPELLGLIRPELSPKSKKRLAIEIPRDFALAPDWKVSRQIKFALMRQSQKESEMKRSPR